MSEQFKEVTYYQTHYPINEEWSVTVTEELEKIEEIGCSTIVYYKVTFKCLDGDLWRSRNVFNKIPISSRPNIKTNTESSYIFITSQSDKAARPNPTALVNQPYYTMESISTKSNGETINHIYQPLVLVDSDYPDLALFTLVNLCPDETPSTIEMVIKRTVNFISKVNPNINSDIQKNTYRIPMINSPKTQYLGGLWVCNKLPVLDVIELRRGTPYANGLDLSFDKEVTLLPRGIYEFVVVNLFAFREMESSPNQFLLRSSISRLGISISVLPLKDQNQSVSCLKVQLRNDSKLTHNIGERFMQLIVGVELQPILNADSLIIKQDGENIDSFFVIKTKPRKLKC
jgi:hypothetical protein